MGKLKSYWTDTALFQVTEIREKASAWRAESLTAEHSREEKLLSKTRDLERPFWGWAGIAALFLVLAWYFSHSCSGYIKPF